MKKVLTIMLAAMIMISLVACGTKTDDEAVNTDNIAQTEENNQEDVKNESEETKKETDQRNEQETVKSQENEKKPQQSDKKPVQPTEKPASKPEEEKKPASTPEQQPEQSQKSTLGNTLLSDFKAKANSGMSVQEIAEGLLQNPAILFSGGAMPVEEGMLSGFDNTEIKGFKSGYTFAPMIGSIAFVGYVFELENASDAPAFISKLKSSANMRWNICVEAEEMVAGSAGNKVFFVMCPKSLEE